MAKLQPVAVCTVCGKTTHSAQLINQRCGWRHGGRRCRGVYGSALRPDDWLVCDACNGDGCHACEHVGWVFVRNRR